MTTKDVLARMDAQPFAPFRLCLRDGQRVDITAADHILPGAPGELLLANTAAHDYMFGPFTPLRDEDIAAVEPL